jgi:hypothetical protein
MLALSCGLKLNAIASKIISDLREHQALLDHDLTVGFSLTGSGIFHEITLKIRRTHCSLVVWKRHDDPKVEAAFNKIRQFLIGSFSYRRSVFFLTVSATLAYFAYHVIDIEAVWEAAFMSFTAVWAISFTSHKIFPTFTRYRTNIMRERAIAVLISLGTGGFWYFLDRW